MKVLIVHPSVAYMGGAERVILNLANTLVSMGVEVEVATSRITYEFRRNRKFKIHVGRLPDKLEELGKYDVVNPHNHPAELWVAPKYTHTVWTCNEPPPYAQLGGEIIPEEKRIVKENIDRIIVNSNKEKRRIKLLYEMDSVVIYYGIDVEYWKSRDRELKRHVCDKYSLKDTFNIITVGWVSAVSYTHLTLPTKA